MKKSLFSARSYLLFFAGTAFIVTNCMLLFLNNLDVIPENIEKSAIVTFVNVIFLSFLLCVFDAIRRKITIERPIKRILRATERITAGDFKARIEPLHGLENANELDEIIKNFNIMSEELSGTETLRTDFIANVSHELKTPLSIIQNYATMLQNPNITTERQVEYAKTISEASRRLTSMITNILKLNKLENQQIFPEVRKYDLGNQLCDCILGFEEEFEKKELDIKTDIDEQIMVDTDSQLLELVWNNLLSNAVKFTGTGGVITISLKTESEYAVVHIQDTGCGISTEVGTHIFEKFYQGDKSHATVGNGLGLALMKRVIDIVGGEISVKSELGKGTLFVVKLKINLDEDNIRKGIK